MAVGPVSEATSLKIGEGVASRWADKLPWFERVAAGRQRVACTAADPRWAQGVCRNDGPGDRVPTWRVL